MSESVHSVCTSCGGANGSHLITCDRDRPKGCTATAGECRCGLDEHDESVAHECADVAACGGSWRESSDGTFEAIRFPGLGTGNPVLAMASILGMLADEEEDDE